MELLPVKLYPILRYMDHNKLTSFKTKKLGIPKEFSLSIKKSRHPLKPYHGYLFISSNTVRHEFKYGAAISSYDNNIIKKEQTLRYEQLPKDFIEKIDIFVMMIANA